MKRVLATLSILLAMGAHAHDRFAAVEVKTEKASDSVYMLVGAGGNIGVSAGEDGVLMVDDQFEPLAPKIKEAINALSDKNIRFLVNTHYHGDHTGGNAWFAKTEGTTIFAHDNVRVRLQNGDNEAAALPVVTYEQGVKFHFNGDTIHVIHTPSSHTDGDSFVWFETQNIIHAGDLLFNYMFPYIDLNGGGTVPGFITSIEAMIDAANDTTKIIPGHGKMASKADLQNYLAMLKETAAAVKAMKDAGKSLEEAVSTGLDSKWESWSWNFINEEKWISTLYNGQ
ncbi:MAG: MBL fold metallo-hydrolase [Alteromonadaceae bacterium]|nr:MBL fold metallo-hydrolase [Alteromonadaceae bacterium]